MRACVRACVCVIKEAYPYVFVSIPGCLQDGTP